MADFNPAFQRTMKFEGITLEEVPGDPGGLTFCGIARNPNPGWSGWSIIDAYIQSSPDMATTRHLAINDPSLMALVEQFYQASIWNQNQLGFFNDQELANQVYDAVVNIGQRAMKALQGLLAITADGVVGMVTLGAVNSVEDPSGLVDQFIHWRKNYYTSLVLEKPQMKKFLDGWLNRCVRSDNKV